MHDTETSSLCWQLCVPQLLCAQLSMSLSVPVHTTLSNQIFTVAPRYLFPINRPMYLRNRYRLLRVLGINEFYVRVNNIRTLSTEVTLVMKTNQIIRNVVVKNYL